MPRAVDNQLRLAINRRVIVEAVLVFVLTGVAGFAATCAWNAWQATEDIPGMHDTDTAQGKAIDALIVASTTVKAQQNVIILMLDRIDRREGGPGAPEDLVADAERELRQ